MFIKYKRQKKNYDGVVAIEGEFNLHQMFWLTVIVRINIKPWFLDDSLMMVRWILT